EPVDRVAAGGRRAADPRRRDRAHGERVPDAGNLLTPLRSLSVSGRGEGVGEGAEGAWFPLTLTLSPRGNDASRALRGKGCGAPPPASPGRRRWRPAGRRRAPARPGSPRPRPTDRARSRPRAPR